jgi:proteic killer suppression protein
MIKGFKHKGLQELFEQGTTRKIQQTMHARCLRQLDALKDATRPEDTVHVNGPWCITFEFVDGDADRVDYEQYH